MVRSSASSLPPFLSSFLKVSCPVSCIFSSFCFSLFYAPGICAWPNILTLHPTPACKITWSFFPFSFNPHQRICLLMLGREEGRERNVNVKEKHPCERNIDQLPPVCTHPDRGSNFLVISQLLQPTNHPSPPARTSLLALN